MEKDYQSVHMVLYSKENGNMDSYKDKVNIMVLMAHIKETGNVINLMASVFKRGKMEVCMKGFIKMAKSKVKEIMSGLISLFIKGNGIMVKYKEKENISIKMVKFIKVFFLII